MKRFDSAMQERDSLLCVGLDPDRGRLGRHDPVAFNRAMVDATAPYAAAYKLQFAFYEALGADGWRALEDTLAHIKRHHPQAATIADAKRCDVEHTARAYAQAIFGNWEFDAVTLVPYMGSDGVTPFLEHAGRGVFMVCATSNPAAGQFQDRPLADRGGQPLYEHVAERMVELDPERIGLVVGATRPERVAAIRERHPGTTILAPGVGAQGGDLEATVRAGVAQSRYGLLINSSRGVVNAYGEGLGEADLGAVAEAAAAAARKLRDEINNAKPELFH